jgi:hypothetical protein
MWVPLPRRESAKAREKGSQASHARFCNGPRESHHHTVPIKGVNDVEK